MIVECWTDKNGEKQTYIGPPDQRLGVYRKEQHMIIECWKDNDGFRLQLDTLKADLSVESYDRLILYLTQVRDMKPGSFAKCEFEMQDWDDADFQYAPDFAESECDFDSPED